MSTAKQAILKAKIQGQLQEILVKTSAAYVMYDETTTVAAKLAAMIADIATKASAQDLTTGLAGKADTGHKHEQADVNGLVDALAGKAAAEHTHEQAEVTGLTDALAARPTTEAMNTAISTAISELINGAPETYDTLKEIADYITEHADVVTALNEAIGKKADNAEFQTVKAAVEALGAVANLDKITEDYLSDELKAKIASFATTETVNGIGDRVTKNEQDIKDLQDAIGAEGNVSEQIAAAVKVETEAREAAVKSLQGVDIDLTNRIIALEEVDHTHANKAELDKVADGDVAKWNDAAGKAHTHENKAVLDGVTADKVAAWDGKSNVYYSATEPANMTEKDLWIQIVE